MSIDNKELLAQRQKGVYKEFVWECEPNLHLLIKMPDPMEYNKQYKALRAKNANMIASVTKGKSKEELENMTNEQAVKAIEGTGDFLLFADDLEELNLNLFEAGMPDGWKLKYLSPEEFEELTKKVNNFFVPAKKTGGNTPPIQSGETL